jgi:hypothetical protein
LERWVSRAMERYFQMATLWSGEPPQDDEGTLRERFGAAQLAVVKRP